MKYDFDKITDRKGTDCLKYDFAKERGRHEGILPLWVADMDFPTLPQVSERLRKITEHGIYGYSDAKEPGEAVLLQQPVYYPFSEVIADNERVIVNNPLKLIEGHYEIDFDDFEQKIRDNNVKLFWQDLIENKANLWLDSGAMFGPDGEGFERFNVACPRSVLKQAFEQLEAAVNSL